MVEAHCLRIVAGEGMRSTLGISPKITLVNPHSIERSIGKAKRVIDNRKLHD
jgi:phenylacetate-CoA ligase